MSVNQNMKSDAVLYWLWSKRKDVEQNSFVRQKFLECKDRITVIDFNETFFL